MEMYKQNVSTAGLDSNQAELRYELFDWLKSKSLTVEQAISLLNLTVSQIRVSAEKQKL